MPKINTTKIQDFYTSIKKDDNHRFKSWEHCFNAFSKIKDEDILSLHLAFYLASWGMYRGSTGLLQKDYKVHLEAVSILNRSDYAVLKCSNVKDISPSDIDKILDLNKELIDCYQKIDFTKDGKNNKISATKTLVSKIILGAMGCLPAYDTYFLKGLIHQKIKATSITKRSLKNLFAFIKENELKIQEIQNEINPNGTYYPIMKIIDMYFWQIGLELSPKKELV